MNKTVLEQIKEYCKGKTIIVVGNSSSILKKEYGQFIDSHQVVVRMNGACPINPSYYKKIGKRTDIYVVSYKSIEKSKALLDTVKPKFGLRLNVSEKFHHPICYFSTSAEYSELNSKFKNSKPSTGSMTINFFKNHIDYKELSLIGFDNFKNAKLNNRPNEFGSYLYKDHCSNDENIYIKSSLDEKTKHIEI
jgi:hypothetical protein